MSEPNVRVKIWVDDDSFEASFAIPVTAKPKQMKAFVAAWFGALNTTLHLDEFTAPDRIGNKGDKHE